MKEKKTRHMEEIDERKRGKKFDFSSGVIGFRGVDKGLK